MSCSFLNVENIGRSFERKSIKGNGGNWENGRSKSMFRKNVKCWNCGKNGHMKKNCRHQWRSKTWIMIVLMQWSKRYKMLYSYWLIFLSILRWWIQELLFIPLHMRLWETILLGIMKRYIANREPIGICWY